MSNYEDKYIMLRCKVQDNKITIFKEYQKLGKMDGIEYQNREFKKVVRK